MHVERTYPIVDTLHIHKGQDIWGRNASEKDPSNRDTTHLRRTYQMGTRCMSGYHAGVPEPAEGDKANGTVIIGPHETVRGVRNRVRAGLASFEKRTNHIGT